MANFGTTPLSVTTVGAGQIPTSAVFVPGSGAAGNMTAVEGIAINTDVNGFQTSAMRIGLLDGDDVTMGLKADAAVTGDNSGTLSAKIRGINKILASLNAAGQNAASPANELLVAGQFNTTPTTITSGNISPLQLDASGNLLVNIKAGNVGSSTATGSAVPANAFYFGGIAKTALPTAATDGNLTGAMLDKFGRAVVLVNAMRDLVSPITQLTLTSTTTETTLIAAVASVFLDIVSLVVVNTSATVCQLDFRDSTGGTIRATHLVPPTDERGISLPVPLPQNTVNNNWTVKCGTSVASIIITGTYISNK